MRHALARRTFEKRHRSREPVEIDFEFFHVGNAFPRGGRLGHGDAHFVHAGRACGFQRVEPADSARGKVEQRAVLRRGALEARAQLVVAQRPAREHDDGNAAGEQRLGVLPHGFVRGGFDDDLRAGGDQPGRADDEVHSELVRERSAAGILAAPGEGDRLRVTHFAAPRVLEEEPRDDAAAEEADPHVSRAAFSS